MSRLTRRRLLQAALAAGAAGGVAGLGALTDAVRPRPAMAGTTSAPERLPFLIHMVLPGEEGPQERAFRYHLLEHGLRAEVVVHRTGDDPSRLPAIVASLKALRPDLIYTTGTPTTLGVAGRFDAPEDGRFIRDIPIVFTTVADPVAAGLIPSLERPGRNVTGSSHLAPLEQQLAALLAYRPVRRIGMLYNPAEANAVLAADRLASLATSQGIALLRAAVPLDATGLPRHDAVAGQVAGLARDGAEFLYIGPDTFVASRAGAMVTQAALDHRLPSFAAVEITLRLKPGALVGLVSSENEQGLAAGYKAELILLQGRDPASLPSHPLAHHSLLVNVPTARALDLFPPMEIITVAHFITD